MNKASTIKDYNYFLKGDISGIQEFIFNVKSEGAAKALKGRSFFIEALSLIAIEMIKKEIGEENIEVFYNGGGNFYLKLKKCSKETMDELQKEINHSCWNHDFYLTLSFIPIQGLENFGDVWKAINKKSEEEKLQKFKTFLRAFTAYKDPIPRKQLGETDKEFEERSKYHNWKGVTTLLKGGKTGMGLKGYNFEEVMEPDVKYHEKAIQAFGFKLIKGKRTFENTILTMPVWSDDLIAQKKATGTYQRIVDANERKDSDYEPPKSGDIIEFNSLAEFAYERTGTKKIAILKMDVDSLGDLFGTLQKESSAKSISKIISNFFKNTIEEKLEEKHSDQTGLYKDNVYTVFSGGDDCFFVGAWDVMLDWALELGEAFKKLSVKEVQPIVEKNFGGADKIPRHIKRLLPVSISGAFLMLEPTYPVTRFADFAESALKDAKGFVYNNKEAPAKKNKINVLGEVLQWQEFEKALSLAKELNELVCKKNAPEPRSTIEKIRSTAPIYKKMQTDAINGKLTGPSVSRLFYSLRNSPNIQQLSLSLINPFAKDLIAAFTQKAESNPMKYPLAARIAEFLTRKKCHETQEI